MSWQKFSDRARESRKVRKAPLDAVGFWWTAGNYCAEHQTDGFIAKEDIADVYRPLGHSVNHNALAAKCVSHGLFVDHGSYFEIHDFLEFNPSKEDQDKKKLSDAKRAAAYRAREKALKKRGIESVVTRDGVRDELSDGVRDGVGDATRDDGVTHDERHAGPDTRDPSGVRHAPPVPSRPVPDPPRFSESERAPEAPHTPRPAPVDRVPEPEQGFTARRMAVAFVAEYEAVQRSTPNMGGKHVGDLHATVLRTAELQRVEPSALFVATVRTWLSKPLTERERQSPYACFTQAWGGLTGAGKRDVRKGFVEPAPASAFTNPTNLDDVFGPEIPIEPPQPERFPRRRSAT